MGFLWLLLLVIFWLLMMFGMMFGDDILDIIRARMGHGGDNRLSAKDEKQLRAKMEAQQEVIDYAGEVLREVQAADKALPQLPQDTRDRVDEFLAHHRPQPTLPPSLKKKR